jgi:RNA polymerase sigma-70 factor (ECF subfamily)
VTTEQERQAAELMARAQTGDRPAYADLLVLLTSAARRYVRGKAGGAPWADDAVQETLLSVHRARHTYDTSRPFAPWFYAIAQRRLIDVVRRERRTSAREIGGDDLPAAAAPGPADDPEIDAAAIHAAMRALTPRQREIVSALKLEDQSVKDISARLGMSESAVKVTAHRGYKALRRLLGSRDDRAD